MLVLQLLAFKLDHLQVIVRFYLETGLVDDLPFVILVAHKVDGYARFVIPVS